MEGSKPAAGQPAGQRLRAEITAALSGLEYGQVVILIKDGKVTQIERTDKKRLPRLEGLNGEGI